MFSRRRGRGQRVLVFAPRNWWQDGNSTKLCQERFKLDISKKFIYCEGGQTLEKAS